ncbi:hypothetical protein LH464_14670 [Neorhizobium sp. T786]|uniref:hypothetical protein n=1 Tax=Pseudorhizobium xiangyangii TaxID=2883104 RepID=UPI001CFFB0CA|nr:hypothetical protein [Neorhizobium xiangyangii]MCB5203720.1 hypothetical protein [Neorhizobium xiangyangii]
MDHAREIELCEPAPFLYYENGQLAVTDGMTVWLVIVTCEAIKATARPPEKSLRRLARFAGFYRDLAAAAISRGDDVNGKVFIRESDILSAVRPLPSIGAASPSGFRQQPHRRGTA